MRIEERAFELRPESPRTAARGRRADDARIRAPRRAQTLDVVARHQDVAVRHDDPVVRGRTPALADVVELWVVADRLVADEQPGGNMRMRRDQAPHERRGGVVGARRAEDDLIAGIVEVEGRTQRLLDMVFYPADRPDETDASDVGRRARAMSRSLCAQSGSPEIARQSD